ALTDAGTLDTHTVTVTWGDGSTSDAVVDAGTRTFAATHQYLDDPAVGDDFTITATATDDDGGVGTATATITVNNVAPAAVDADAVTITWGDGATSEAVVDAATRTFTASHLYKDDNVADRYAVTATITDDDGGLGSATTQATVTNSAPVITALSTDATEVGA